MSKNDILIKPFAISGYRSFGAKFQRFEKLSKINLFIGQNNSGKSNILRFIHEAIPKLFSPTSSFDSFEKHLPDTPPLQFGLRVSLEENDSGVCAEFNEEVLSKLPSGFHTKALAGRLLTAFQKKAELDGTKDAWFEFDENKKLINDDWVDPFLVIPAHELKHIWSGLTNNSSGGSRDEDWFPVTIKRLAPTMGQPKSALIPAIREVRSKSSESEEYSGEGIIEHIARLQNPDVTNQSNKNKFEKINSFLQNVTDNNTARIEIPYDRSTILVHMDGKTLPLDSLGTGIHEVIILASASTTLDRTVVCMEEPELHLNPTLQKKLVRYLQFNTTNQYFISTHSTALMDTPEAEIYHINLIGGQSVVDRVTSDRHKSSVCEDLGYHPSDLLQSNCLIWVEGPSDRIYINFWINSEAPGLIEGIHYSIMFYGGRLAAHVSGEDITDQVEEFISLRRINRKGVIIIDSDKDKSHARVNSTKKRLKDEFNRGPGFSWITDGREIENYFRKELIEDAINTVHSTAEPATDFRRYDNVLAIKAKNGKNGQVSKIKIAKFITSKYEADLSPLDLKPQIKRTIDFIQASNPAIYTGK